MKTNRALTAKLDNFQRRFPPTFPRLIEIILNEARQSDYLESHWYHFYGEILFTLTRAASNMEIVFSVAAQRTFTFVPTQPVDITRADRPITRPFGQEDDESDEDDRSTENLCDDEQDVLMGRIDVDLARIFGDDPNASGSTESSGYSEGAIHRTPDFTVYLHNFGDGVNIPVMIVEDKATPLPRTVEGRLLSMTEGSYADRRWAAALEMKNHLKQKREQLTHLFDEYRGLKFVYYCLTVGEWFRMYKVDREGLLDGARQNPSTNIRLIWDNGVVDQSMLELFIEIAQPDNFY